MTAVERIQELLGGESVTGPLKTDYDLMRLVRTGLPTQALDSFLRSSHLTFNAIETHVLPRRTFKRRQEADQRLDMSESDRLVRLARLFVSATETFGDVSKAFAWLNRENRTLDGNTPLSLADTDQGVRSVETALGRIAHGIAA
ncbi:MAG: toxin-antitoxin system antitoxin component family protein [Caulobacter sp.]|nr:toxin-antitoxin system antitoxin component family protein [Caulobacter sp.]